MIEGGVGLCRNFENECTTALANHELRLGVIATEIHIPSARAFETQDEMGWGAPFMRARHCGASASEILRLSLKILALQIDSPVLE